MSEPLSEDEPQVAGFYEGKRVLVVMHPDRPQDPCTVEEIQALLTELEILRASMKALDDQTHESMRRERDRMRTRAKIAEKGLRRERHEKNLLHKELERLRSKGDSDE